VDSVAGNKDDCIEHLLRLGWSRATGNSIKEPRQFGKREIVNRLQDVVFEINNFAEINGADAVEVGNKHEICREVPRPVKKKEIECAVERAYLAPSLSR
jgi:hypothetical protein